MKLKFVKVCGYWFVDNPGCGIDRVLDMQMVDGADNMLDEILAITKGDCSVTIEIVDNDSNNFDVLLGRLAQDEIGTSYSVTSRATIGIRVSTIWLCNVCKEMLGEHPETIKFKIIY